MSRIARQSLCSFINTQSCKTQTEDSMPSLSREPSSVAWVGNHLLAASWVEIRVLGPCSWTPRFLNSSILQFVNSTRQVLKSSRNSSIPQFFYSSRPQETPRFLNSSILQVLKKHHELVHRRVIQTHISTVPSLLGPDAYIN